MDGGGGSRIAGKGVAHAQGDPQVSVVIGGGDEGALAGRVGERRGRRPETLSQGALPPGRPKARAVCALAQSNDAAAGRQAVEQCPYPEVARNLLLHVAIELLIRPSALARQRREKPHTQRWVGGLAAPAGRAP